MMGDDGEIYDHDRRTMDVVASDSCAEEASGV